MREHSSGFSFIAPWLDNNPKYYYYETIESGYAGQTGYLAAVGLPNLGPTAVVDGTWGRIKSLYHCD